MGLRDWLFGADYEAKKQVWTFHRTFAYGSGDTHDVSVPVPGYCSLVSAGFGLTSGSTGEGIGVIDVREAGNVLVAKVIDENLSYLYHPPARWFGNLPLEPGHIITAHFLHVESGKSGRCDVVYHLEER